MQFVTATDPEGFKTFQFTKRRLRRVTFAIEKRSE